MPITRSKGKNAEAWIVDLGDGPSTSTPAITQPPRTPITDSAELPCPPSPIQAPLLAPSSTEFPVSPCDQRGMIIQKGDAANKLQLTQTVRRATSAISRPVESVKSRKTDRSRRKLDAREEYLRIKLELARLAIQKAESQDSEYDEEGPSKEDYVRSWIEEIPDSTSQPDDDFATKEDFEIQQSGNLPPPRLVDINAQKEQQLKLSLKENKFPLKI